VILTSERDMTSAYFFSYNLYLKGCQLCPTFSVFLERESMSQPYYVFVGLPPSLIMPPSVQFGFFLGIKLCERRFGYFHGEFLEFQSYSKYINHIDIGLKQTCSEEIQVIFMVRVSISVENFCVCFW